MTPRQLPGLFLTGLALWGTGCLWLEPLASVGMALCAVGVGVLLLRGARPDWRLLARA